MPYKRPVVPSTPSEIVPVFESAIKSLVRRFRNHPYAFYTENDLHCYLYHRLYEGGMANAIYRTSEGYDTILLHKEFPTESRYQRQGDGTLAESETGRRRGAFDMCIWDPEAIGQNEHRKQKVLCAAELALDECSAGSVHTINDATKLAGPSNAVRYGYLLFFVRNAAAYRRNQAEIDTNLKDAATRVRVVFVMVDGKDKPKPTYSGDWGVI